MELSVLPLPHEGIRQAVVLLTNVCPFFRRLLNSMELRSRIKGIRAVQLLLIF